MQNNFIKVTTKSGKTHYVNISHIVDIWESDTGGSVINTINSTIYSDTPAITFAERVYKNQWNGETKDTGANTK